MGGITGKKTKRMSFPVENEVFKRNKNEHKKKRGATKEKAP